MSQIPRRGFLASLAALITAPCLPTPTLGSTQLKLLAFHPDSFALAMMPLTIDRVFNVDFEWTLAERFTASENYRKYLAADAAIQESLT